ncbi:DcaP family trimeric outer membrane transporter [Halomonas sp. KM072]
MRDAGSANEGYFAEVAGSEDERDVGDQFQVTATQSRIGFRTSTPVEGGTLDTVIEGDFWSYNDDNTRFRLRHAYGSWNGILAGQTWSNYNTFVAATPTLDFLGTAGSNGYGSRLAQLRYTMGGFSIAAEDPKAQLAENIDGSVPEEDLLPDNDDAVSSMPALSLRYEDSMGDFSYSIAGIARQLKYDTGSEKDTEMGYGAFAAGAYHAGPVTLRAIVNASEGANSYLYLSGDYFNGADAYVDTNGKLQTLSGDGGALGLSYQISPQYSLNASHGYTDVELGDPTVGGNAGRKNKNTFLNLMWTPNERLMYGIEYGYFETELADGREEDASRVMVAAQYSF